MPRHHRFLPLPALALALVCAFAASAQEQEQVFTWVDNAGVRHYSQTRPDGVNYEIRDFRNPQVEVPAVAPAAVAPDAADQRACERARLTLAQLATAGPLEMDKDGDGTMEPLTAEDRAAQQRLAEQAVRAFCVPTGTGGPAGR